MKSLLSNLKNTGAEGESRTPDTAIFSSNLYQILVVLTGSLRTVFALSPLVGDR